MALEQMTTAFVQSDLLFLGNGEYELETTETGDITKLGLPTNVMASI